MEKKRWGNGESEGENESDQDGSVTYAVGDRICALKRAANRFDTSRRPCGRVAPVIGSFLASNRNSSACPTSERLREREADRVLCTHTDTLVQLHGGVSSSVGFDR